MNGNRGIPSQYQKYNTQYGDAIEKIGWMWWDTASYVSTTTTQLTFFTAARANRILSNMEIVGQLASPKAFLVRAIRIQPLILPFVTTAAADGNTQTGSLDDLRALLNTSYCEITIGQKTYGQFLSWTLPAGGGVVPFMQTGDIDVVVEYGNNGVADPRAAYTLSTPLFIAPQINFRVDMYWAAALTLDGGNTNIAVILDGDLLRPVQ